jgi:transposase
LAVLPFFKKLAACLVGIEAGATSHRWSRELQALGHKVSLMPPAYVKPYVKRQKNYAADAKAICEAVTRANMRFGSTISQFFARDADRIIRRTLRKRPGSAIGEAALGSELKNRALIGKVTGPLTTCWKFRSPDFAECAFKVRR